MVAIIVGIGIIVLVILAVVSIYNSLVRMKNRCDATWGQVDVQLKRRHDLIPNLVETAKGYIAHERGTLESVTQARSACLAAKGPKEQAQAENLLTGTLRTLFAVAENYPNLKANENMLALQAQLAETENAIAATRETYNVAVRNFNNACQVVPSNVIASVFGFAVREYFQAGEGASREAPKVQF